MTETVQQFKMGAAIPEWLLAMEPINDQSRMGSSRFGCDVDVLETDAYFLICPTNILMPVAGILDFAGGYNCGVVATGKPVRIVQGETVPFPRGMGVPGNPPPYGICVQPWAPMALSPAVQVPDPHKSFWARLRYAFGG